MNFALAPWWAFIALTILLTPRTATGTPPSSAAEAIQHFLAVASAGSSCDEQAVSEAFATLTDPQIHDKNMLGEEWGHAKPALESAISGLPLAAIAANLHHAFRTLISLGSPLLHDRPWQEKLLRHLFPELRSPDQAEGIDRIGCLEEVEFFVQFLQPQPASVWREFAIGGSELTAKIHDYRGRVLAWWLPAPDATGIMAWLFQQFQFRHDGSLDDASMLSLAEVVDHAFARQKHAPKDLWTQRRKADVTDFLRKALDYYLAATIKIIVQEILALPLDLSSPPELDSLGQKLASLLRRARVYPNEEKLQWRIVRSLLDLFPSHAAWLLSRAAPREALASYLAHLPSWGGGEQQPSYFVNLLEMLALLTNQHAIDLTPFVATIVMTAANAASRQESWHCSSGISYWFRQLITALHRHLAAGVAGNTILQSLCRRHFHTLASPAHYGRQHPEDFSSLLTELVTLGELCCLPPQADSRNETPHFPWSWAQIAETIRPQFLATNYDLLCRLRHCLGADREWEEIGKRITSFCPYTFGKKPPAEGTAALSALESGCLPTKCGLVRYGLTFQPTRALARLFSDGGQACEEICQQLAVLAVDEEQDAPTLSPRSRYRYSGVLKRASKARLIDACEAARGEIRTLGDLATLTDETAAAVATTCRQLLAAAQEYLLDLAVVRALTNYLQALFRAPGSIELLTQADSHQPIAQVLEKLLRQKEDCHTPPKRPALSILLMIVQQDVEREIACYQAAIEQALTIELWPSDMEARELQNRLIQHLTHERK